MKILRINNKEKGYYYVVEQIKEDFLKREFGIERFAVIRNTSDWSRKEGYGIHFTDNYLFSGYIRSEGDSLFSKALYQYKLLSDHILNKRYNEAILFFDREYMGKFLAFITLFNDIHFISGDNMKLIYDFDNDKVYPVYRGETLGVPINENVDYKVNFSNFDKFLFSSHLEKYKDTKTGLLFKVLLGNKEIFNKRNEYLYQLVNSESDLLGEIDLVYKDNYRVMLHSSKSRRKNEMVRLEQKRIVSTVLDYAKEYLSYSHVYGSYNSGSSELEIFSDAFSPITVHSPSSSKLLSEPINGITLDDNLDVKSIYHKIKVVDRLLSTRQLVFINEVTNDTIPSVNIHMIDTTYFPQRIKNN